MKPIINGLNRHLNLNGIIQLAALVLTIGAVFIAGVSAQSENGSASLEGTIRDQNGAVVQGASVIVKNTETNLTRTVTTNADGTFSVNVLPVGSYEVTVKATGFLETPVKVSSRVGETTPVDIVLAPQGATALVNITGDNEAIDSESQSSGSLISPRLVQDLPVRGRNFTEFVSLTPAVVQEGDRNGLVISGQRSINSNVSIDGADFNDALQGNQRGGN